MEQAELKQLFTQMTLEEKIGQMTQITGEHYIGKVPDEMVETGPWYEISNLSENALYVMGSVLGASSAKVTNAVQKAYLDKSRLKIPLLFMHDAIHGYKNIFPIPLALSCSFDEQILYDVAKLTAAELRSSGIHVNFSPMADLTRDSRWGRVMEGFGEDQQLTGDLGKAMIHGYQQSDDNGVLDATGVAACLKHFAAYGAPVGGKEYNTVDMSMREFYSAYGKPYEIALKADPRFVMSSFNSFNGVPITASEEMMQDVLRGRYGFDGIVISDWGAVSELMNHSVAENGKEAATLAMKAGIDIEMVSTHYLNNGELITTENPELLQYIDQATYRILELKNELGLFENPFVDEASEPQVLLNEAALARNQEIVKRSCVLLKNQNDILPLKPEQQNLLIVGPYARTNELLGNWMCRGEFKDVINLPTGFAQIDATRQVKAYDSHLDVPSTEVAAADAILLTIGESWRKSGEGCSSVDLELSPEQKSMIKWAKASGKRVVCLGFAGRPMALQNVIDDIDALLWCWYPGTMAGAGIAELVLGHDTPTGKLTMSFPRYSAQAPLYYNEFAAGRPANQSSQSNRYQDAEIGALFPFGHGLTYASAEYNEISLSAEQIAAGKPVTVTCKIHNPSSFNYSEIVTLYIKDCVAKAVRPVRELKQYQLVPMLSGQTSTAKFELSVDDLYYYDGKLNWIVEPGKFEIYLNDLAQPIGVIEL